MHTTHTPMPMNTVTTTASARRLALSPQTGAPRTAKAVRTGLTIALTAITLVGLCACHTVKGVGRDIEAMGQSGQDMIDGKR